MPYYDHFYSERKRISKIGEWIVSIQNNLYLKLILSFCKNKEDINILEIGPGKGYFAKLCSKYDKISYSSIEANEKQAKILKNKGYDVEKFFVPPIKKPSDTFDVVLMSNILEHMNDSISAITLVKEAFRVLKKEGLHIIASPDYLLWKYDFFNADYTHNYVTTLTRAIEIIEDNGFETIYKNYLSGPFIGNILTFIISQLIRLLYFTRIPYIFSWNRNMEEKLYKLKMTFLRKFLIVGKKHV